MTFKYAHSDRSSERPPHFVYGLRSGFVVDTIWAQQICRYRVLSTDPTRRLVIEGIASAWKYRAREGDPALAQVGLPTRWDEAWEEHLHPGLAGVRVEAGVARFPCECPHDDIEERAQCSNGYSEVIYASEAEARSAADAEIQTLPASVQILRDEVRVLRTEVRMLRDMVRGWAASR